jgi:transcriptional regulator with PAS, ATPase and Fis domain
MEDLREPLAVGKGGCAAAPEARDLVGQSRAIEHIRDMIRRLRGPCSTTLIQGETGTGKEVVALMLHRNSNRAKAPLVAVNCAAIPEALIEGELFGYEKGAFSSANHAHPGKFRLADKGTLFLDEVGELSAGAQAKILRSLESGEVFPLGSTKAVQVDVRVVAATNRDLASEVEKGNFRADLYYRLAVIQLLIPPLRDRREDIVPIARALLERICPEIGVAVPALSKGLLAAFEGHGWPGNVREMRNALEHAVVVAMDPERLDVDDLPPTIGIGPAPSADSFPPGTERETLLRALARANGKKAEAARMLNCSRMTLYRRLERVRVADAEDFADVTPVTASDGALSHPVTAAHWPAALTR